MLGRRLRKDQKTQRAARRAVRVAFVFATYTLEVIRKVSGNEEDEEEEEAALWRDGGGPPPCEQRWAYRERRNFYFEATSKPPVLMKKVQFRQLNKYMDLPF